MKLLKKNQIVIYVIALMLMAVAYLNYTTNTAEQSVQASMQMEARDDSNTANIGDATLVSSNDVVGTNTTSINDQAENQTGEATQNTSNETASNSLNTGSTEETSSSAGTSSDEYFTKSKLERDTMYSQMIET